MKSPADTESVDDVEGIVIRKVIVGPLATNCWILHSVDSPKALVIDPGDEPARILDAVRDLRVTAIVLTHSHWDHVLAVPELADALGCKVLMHPADAPIWPHELDHLRELGHFDAGTATDQLLGCGCTLAPPPGTPLWTGTAHPVRHRQRLAFGDNRSAQILHTPGHTPGGISILAGNHVFTGDTLFPGGPGLTGWPFSDFPTIIRSIQQQLFTLPGQCAVHPGHGHSTTIETERPQLGTWAARGW